MRKIKIFIGSSIDDLAYERRDLVSFIAELNNKYIDRGIYIEPYICEEKSNEMRPEGSQKVHDEYIENDADVSIFMFFRKAGKYTLRELQIAKNTLTSKAKKSHVFIYFKTINNEVADTSEIKVAIDKIAGEYAHYYKKFSEADTIKLELLQYLSNTLGETSLTIQDGKVYIGDIEANDIELSNVFAYQNNSELIALKKELAEIEKQIQVCVEEKSWAQLAQLTDKHQEKQVQYSNLESEILKMLQQLFKCLQEKNANPIRLKALMLLEEGKHKEALLLLPLSEIKSKSEAIMKKKTLQDAKIKQEATEILQDGLARLRALGFDVNNTTIDIDIEKTYDSIVDVALIAGQSNILIEYVDYLEEKGNVEKALKIAKLIEKKLDYFDDITLYTKFDTYNLLSELSENEDAQRRYSMLAEESLFAYIENLDKTAWKEYVNACERLCDLFVNTQRVLPFLAEGIRIIEAHPEDRSQILTLQYLCHATGRYYLEMSDFDSAEGYFNKEVSIAEQEISDIDAEDFVQGFLKKIKEKNNDYKVPHSVVDWQFKITTAYEYLYEIAPEKYVEEYMDNLEIYAMMQFVNNKYRACAENFCKIAQLSGDDEKHEKLRQIVESLGKKGY